MPPTRGTSRPRRPARAFWWTDKLEDWYERGRTPRAQRRRAMLQAEDVQVGLVRRRFRGISGKRARALVKRTRPGRVAAGR